MSSESPSATEDDLAWPPGACESTFLLNLQALAQVDRPLAERMCWSVIGGNVVRVDGELTYQAQQSRFPMAIAPEECESLVAAAIAKAAGRPLLAFGLGTGDLLLCALAADAPVVAWDQDPWLFRLVLGTHDLSGYLLSRKLRLSLGTDLLALLDADLVRLEHPLFKRVYSTQGNLPATGLGQRRALLCDGGLFVGSMQRALEAQGWSVWTADVERLSVDELNLAASAIRPQIIVSINHRAGLSEFASEVGARLLVWEIDPTTCLPGAPEGDTDHAWIFSYRESGAQLFRNAGFAHANYLPLAADTTLRQPITLSPAERDHYAAPISFVGASMASSARHNGARFAALHAAWQQSAPSALSADELARLILADQRQDFAHWRVPDLLTQHAPGFSEWCLGQPAGEDPAMLIGELAASEKRLAWISALARHDIQVWGDADWQQTSTRYRGPATHHHDLTRIFNASIINLDIGRIYQPDIVTMRVFDVLACGGFALVEHSDGIEHLFDVGRELDTYRDQSELEEKVSWYLSHPEEARAIGARGRAAVLERHAFADRVQTMLAAAGVDSDLLSV
ncbi:MAG: spore maturation protein CgeB [Chlamydiales bacterium]